MTAEDSVDHVVLDFLVRLVEDLRSGQVRPLEEYQAEFPGADDEIAAEFEAVISEQDDDGGARRTLGPFEIVRELGRGGQGTVFLAVDVRLRRRVALKVIDRGVVPDAGARERLRREAEFASRLDDRGICTVHEIGSEGGSDYIAMRYLGGGSLADRLARRDGPPAAPGIREDVRLIADAARSLHAAHESGIVHRDVKPANIMLDDDGRPVLVDFGFARDETSELVSLTASGVVFGTPPYMSPEQLSGLMRPLDRRTDVYSLGAVLHQLLTGVVPHRAPTVAELLLVIRSTPVRDPRRLNPAIAPDLAVVVTTALEGDLTRRYTTAEAFAEDLDAVLDGRPIAARPAGLWYRSTRWARRNRVAVALLGALVLALVITAVFLWREARLRRNLEELTDGRMVEDLLARETSELLPVREEVVRLGETWLEQAAEVFANRRNHERFRDLLRGRGDALDKRGRWTLERVESLLAGIEKLEARTPDVRRRIERARTHRERWSAGEAAEAWERCRAAIAASPRYGGLEIAPQEGLVPLRESPHSGLWEFFVLDSGEPPRWDEEKWSDDRWSEGDWDVDAGGWRIDEATGIVLVLIPGGVLDMGCRIRPPPGPTDPFQAERPRHPVSLDPFFLSKYEVTQAQWQSLHDGLNPSWYTPEEPRSPEFAGDEVVTRTHPVEFVERDDAVEAARRWGLLLPTEAQWEYACRGGTDDNTYVEGPRADLSLHENLRGAERGGPPGHDDGRVRHAPVGSLGPNPFGLHDMLGNVSEWCRDPVAPRYDVGLHRAGDGLRVYPEASPQDGIVRGASFHKLPVLARCAFRFRTKSAGQDLGFRVARPLWQEIGD